MKTMKKAQTGTVVKKTVTPKAVTPKAVAPKPTPKKATGMQRAFKYNAPLKTETASAKNGKSVKKYQMGGYVSNEFAAKSVAKSKPKSKIVDSEIKTKKGKDIYAFEGKKGMLAKSGAKLKNKK